VESESRYEHLRDDPEALIGIIHKLEGDVERLQVHLLNVNRKMFGKKTERQAPSSSQEELFTFEEEVPTAEEEQTIEVTAHKKTIKRGRKPLPDSLPTRREEYWSEAKACTQCGEELVKIGEEVTEELNYVPARFEKVVHAKIKCACPRCESEGVKTGVLPPGTLPLPGARPGVGLLTFILISKYVDHTPLYRLEQIFARHGVTLSRQRMSDWLSSVSMYLETLWRLLCEDISKLPYVQGDETHIKVRESDADGELLQGYFWGAHAPPEKLAAFHYFPTRAGEAAKEVFHGFLGRVQADAYAGYNPILLPEKVERIACMAHIRRKLLDARPLLPAECDKLIQQIAKLYVFEKKWKELKPEKRFEQREKHARPELEKLFSMMEALQAKILPRHEFQKPLSYALKQRKEMFRYLENGNYHIDNNAIERQIRPIALGRKNYLFAGSHDGAKRAALFYSLLATCKLNNVNPATWLAHVLKTMPTLPRNRYYELLPHRWMPPAQTSANS
jgi:transposase